MRREEAVKRMAQKLNRTAGFTLAETLMAVLILLMVSAVVAGGMPAAMNAYHKAVDAANAQLFLSTTVNALRNELSTAWDVEIGSDKTTITYQSSDTGSKSIIELKDGKIMLQEYAGESAAWLEGIRTGTKRPLVSDKMTTSFIGDMTVSYSSAERIPTSGEIEYVKIKGLEVKNAAGATAAKMPDSGGEDKVLLIRVLTGGERA